MKGRHDESKEHDEQQHEQLTSLQLSEELLRTAFRIDHYQSRSSIMIQHAESQTFHVSYCIIKNKNKTSNRIVNQHLQIVTQNDRQSNISGPCKYCVHIYMCEIDDYYDVDQNVRKSPSINSSFGHQPQDVEIIYR